MLEFLANGNTVEGFSVVAVTRQEHRYPCVVLHPVMFYGSA